ncbi:MAG: trypsin-like peptidase domain-containing protein [Pirellulales bacterium]
MNRFDDPAGDDARQPDASTNLSFSFDDSLKAVALEVNSVKSLADSPLPPELPSPPVSMTESMTAAGATELPDHSPTNDTPQPTRQGVESASETTNRSPGSRAVHRLTWSLTILGFLLVLVSGLPLLVEEIQYRLERGRQRAQVEIATAALGDMNLSDISRAYQMVSQRVGPSVVHINIVEGPREQNEEGTTEPESDLPRRLRRRFDSGQGSGVVIDSDGYIVTNRHVIEEARQIEVVLSDGRRRPAKVIGLDDPTDLAVLKVDATGLIAAEWGDSESLDVGALVWAVGSPFGLERSITFGILSAKNRAGVAGTPFQNLMQTDAAVNPGNSGGPLVDVQGRVIGINTAIVGPSYQGVSFAIPSRVARRVYQDLKTRGEVTRGWLGVEPQSIDEETALQHSLTERKGAFVRRLADGPFGEKSPARAAGIEPGDIILRWNGAEVDSAGGLIARVSQTPVGETVPVVVLRAGKTLDLEVTVGARPVNLE